MSAAKMSKPPAPAPAPMPALVPVLRPLVVSTEGAVDGDASSVGVAVITTVWVGTWGRLALVVVGGGAGAVEGFEAGSKVGVGVGVAAVGNTVTVGKDDIQWTLSPTFVGRLTMSSRCGGARNATGCDVGSQEHWSAFLSVEG